MHQVELLYRGCFALGRSCPRWFFDWAAYGPVAFVLGCLSGAFDHLSDRNVLK